MCMCYQSPGFRCSSGSGGVETCCYSGRGVRVARICFNCRTEISQSDMLQFCRPCSLVVRSNETFRSRRTNFPLKRFHPQTFHIGKSLSRVSRCDLHAETLSIAEYRRLLFLLDAFFHSFSSPSRRPSGKMWFSAVEN